MSASLARRRKQLLKKQQAAAAATSEEASDPVSLRLQTLLATDFDDESDAAQNNYEALQLAQSVVRRHVKLEQNGQAVTLAYDVSMVMLEKKNRAVSVTSQLLALLADVLTETSTPCTTDLVAKLGRIHAAFKHALTKDYSDDDNSKDAEEVDRLNRVYLKFLNKILKWSAEYGPVLYGDTSLHELLGDQCWHVGLKESEEHKDDKTNVTEDDDKRTSTELRAEAVTHFALAENSTAIMKLLLSLPEPTKAQQKTGRDGGTAAERDCLFTRAVLVYISLENLKDANALLRDYCQHLLPPGRDIQILAKSYMAKTDGFAPSHVMFCNMLLQTCEKDRAGPLFQWLLRSFSQDLATMSKPDVKVFTSKIGRVYFGIQPPPSMLNMMENMMGMMGGAGGAGGMAGNPMAAMMQQMQQGG